jgi:hypothetical protein
MWKVGELRHSTFGIPIAMQGATTQRVLGFPGIDQVIQTQSIPRSSWSTRNAHFVMNSVLIGALTVAIYFLCW